MTVDNFESDAELVRNQGDTPAEDASGPAESQANAATDVPEPAAGEPADAPGGEPSDSRGGESADALSGASDAEGAEEPEVAPATPPDGAGGEGEAPDTDAIAAGAALDPEARRRRRLLIGLAALVVLLIAAAVIVIRYLVSPSSTGGGRVFPVSHNGTDPGFGHMALFQLGNQKNRLALRPHDNEKRPLLGLVGSAGKIVDTLRFGYHKRFEPLLGNTAFEPLNPLPVFFFGNHGLSPYLF